MKGKKITLIILIIILLTAMSLGALYIEELSRNWYKKVKNDEFGFEISYPNAYEDLIIETSKVQELSSQITITYTEEEISGYTFTKRVINTKSDMNGMMFWVDALKVDKRPSGEIEDICKNYILNIEKIDNPDTTIVDSNYERVLINGVTAGRVEIYAQQNKNGIMPAMISYLIPLDDREITVTFSGHKKLFEKNSKEIEKIISSLKIKELT